MLHKINVPRCHHALSWIVQFQTDLLTELCAEDVDGTEITVEWVAEKRHDINREWMNRFCSWKRERTTTLSRMRDVAALPITTKQKLLRHFGNNLKFSDAFDSSKNPPPTFTLEDGLGQDAARIYSAFLGLFYDPIFYKEKGFPVDGDGKAGGFFHRNIFLKGYQVDNEAVRVCPLCDGALDDSEVDHWLAKKHFPELVCHPCNLVEICGACNGRSNKGEKPTLSSGNAKPFDDWFHPYLRPANGTFRIQIREKGIIKLKAKSVQDELRIANLDRLINLSKR